MRCQQLPSNNRAPFRKDGRLQSFPEACLEFAKFLPELLGTCWWSQSS